MGFYSPQPVRQQTPPPVLRGNFMDRDAELPEDGSVSGNWATVFMQDVYNGLEPHVKRGEIKQIAVVQEVEKSTHSPFTNKRPDGPGMRAVPVFGFQFPLVSCGATYAPKKVWGLADVADGRQRGVSRALRGADLLPGARRRGPGRAAHADLHAPDAGRGPGLRRLPCRPQLGRAARRQAAHRRTSPPQELRQPAWGVKGFSYPEVVQGVFDRHCIACHNEREQPGNVDLTGDLTDFFNVSYDVLCRTGTQGEKNWMSHGSPSGAEYDKVRGMSPYVEWIWTINGSETNILEIAPRRWGSPASKLAEIIRSGHPDKDGKPQVNVPDEDRRRVYLWMDLNIPYYGTSSSNHKAATRQPPDDAAGPGRDAQRSRRAPLRRVPPGRRAAEVLHPGAEPREEQLPARPAGQGSRRHAEVRPAGLRLDRRSGLPEDPADVRPDPRPAPAAPAGRHAGVRGRVRGAGPPTMNTRAPSLLAHRGNCMKMTLSIAAFGFLVVSHIAAAAAEPATKPDDSAVKSTASGSPKKLPLPDPAAVRAFGDQGTIDARQAPAWWLSRPDEVEAFLRSLPGVEVFELGRSAGNRPILAAAWGQREDLPGRTSASLASAIAGGDPQAFYGQGQRQRQGFLFLGAAHGTEIEGTVAALNFLNVLVTGKDLRGKAWPRMAEAGRQLRVVIVPFFNIDGRERFREFRHFIGMHPDEYRLITNGRWKDGELLGWPESKLHHPVPPDRVDVLGSYYNDHGVNLVYDDAMGGTLRTGDAPRWCSSSAASGPIACSARTRTTAAWSNRAAVSSRRISASGSSRSARWWAAAASAKG